jgi:hypothetical protein
LIKAIVVALCITQKSLDEIYKTFLSAESRPEGRFVLMTADESEKDFFAGKPDVSVGRRYYFEYPGNALPQERTLPDGMELHETDDVLFDRCKGRIIPLFSWEDKQSFLQRGKGFCVTDGDRVAACAFSSAVSGREIDIGVETAEGYRKRGLAYTAARAMIGYILKEKKRPVWACSSENEGSRRLAESLGFVKTVECYTIGRR